jgi:hypothetical protein
MFGTFITYVALPLQAERLTGSTLAVGAIGTCELLPLVVCGLVRRGGRQRRIG